MRARLPHSEHVQQRPPSSPAPKYTPSSSLMSCGLQVAWTVGGDGGEGGVRSEVGGGGILAW